MRKRRVTTNVQLRHCYDLFNYGALPDSFTFEMHKFNKSSTLLLIVVEGYSSAPVASLSSQSKASRSESEIGETLHEADVFCAKA
ncbi:hypothetical protein [Lysinibacillus sp. FJAT-14222]|uniref:hypothetical protein n=1 Tax=Lysinibacillus sp. FJAT-14222 TaxID=1932366 RepID=UPI001160C712|nr:hypothetical protein [Lysinibacillus sp. FJAT-14222]